jgi:hypothetical protein
MLRQKNIEKYDLYVKHAINELFKTAFTNQMHENDLVLVLINGTKNNYPEETLKRLKITNYQIGHDIVHFRYSTFIDFFNQYKMIRDEEDYEDIENKQLFHETMIQMQLLSYMKFWETDLILKRLLNLSRLCQKKEYLWDIKQKELNNRRKLVKDEIQEPIQTLCPKFYAFIDDVYSRQLRNAIAHSQYYIIFDEISLTNMDENQYYHLNNISYSRWDEIFTKIILMHNHMISNLNKYHSFYVKKVKEKHNGLLVYFPEKTNNGLNKTAWIKYDDKRMQWYWNDKGVKIR